MKISRNKLLVSALVLMMFVSVFAVASIFPAMSAYPTTYVGTEYAYLEGVLATDSYTLYPYKTKSLNIGFSKYGEVINPDKPAGLRYSEVDPFANANVSRTEWNEGWLMNITYEYEGLKHNIWAYALFSDFNKTGGAWINGASSPLDNRPGYTGGRKTNGYAVTAPMQVLYDGPRRTVVLLNTTIYDPAILNPDYPDDPKGLPLVDVYIQMVFNKVKKYVILIKDVKLRTESKLLEKVQVKFGQRGEWDLGWKPQDWQPWSFAHFYHALPTKYFKHPWYMTDDMETGYDLCQIIDQDRKYVAYAAFWPELMSWRVESIGKLTREDKLTDLSDWDYYWLGKEGTENLYFIASVPGYYTEPLWYPDCHFPPYWGEPIPDFLGGGWDAARPEVYVDGVLKTEGTHYTYEFHPGEPGGSHRPPKSPGINDPEIPGSFYLSFKTAQADTAKIHVHWKLHAEQDDMTIEPRTPYTMGEWVFDLSYADSALPTNQFRCVTVYGVTDRNNGKDWDYDGSNNIIDKEVMFQLDEVFNPWDLRQAVGQESWNDYGAIYDFDWGTNEDYFPREEWPGKITERWVEFYTGDGVENEFYLPQQIVVPAGDDDPIDYFPAWDAYCSPREKVLVDGKLQKYDTAYDIEWTWYNEEMVVAGPTEIEYGDSFQLMYPRIVVGSDAAWVEDDAGNVLGPFYDYSVDYSNGKIYIWWDGEFDEDENLIVDYNLYFPASFIQFKEGYIPKKDAVIKVLYSTFRIVYKTDKFIAGIDGLTIENEGLDTPDRFGFFWLRYGPVLSASFIRWTVDYVYPNWITVTRNGALFVDWQYGTWCDLPCIWITTEINPSDVIEVTYPIFAGRYEWTTVGVDSAPVDSTGASMVTEGIRQWKNFDTKLASMDYKDAIYGPEVPFIFRNMTGTGALRAHYYDTQRAQTVDKAAGRAHLKDDWCTTLPVSSSNIIAVGGPYVNVAAEYFNDFTDAYVPRIGTTWGTGFYSHACWGRNLYEVEYDEDGKQITGYALISTYKDLNGTKGLIIYGWTGQDTYYACYALQHGLFKIMQWLQPGVTSIILEFNYEVHPSEDCFFHVVECLGTITECGGFDHVLWWELWDWVADTLIFKLVWNSYSSEFWVFHIIMDFYVEYEWHLPYMVGIEITYPQYIYFHWEPKVHDP